MSDLCAEDALKYINQVKVAFPNNPEIYNGFLETMEAFKSHQIDTP